MDLKYAIADDPETVGVCPMKKQLFFHKATSLLDLQARTIANGRTYVENTDGGIKTQSGGSQSRFRFEHGRKDDSASRKTKPMGDPVDSRMINNPESELS
jgi:hypothetical protein